MSVSLCNFTNSNNILSLSNQTFGSIGISNDMVDNFIWNNYLTRNSSNIHTTFSFGSSNSRYNVRLNQSNIIVSFNASNLTTSNFTLNSNTSNDITLRYSYDTLNLFINRSNVINVAFSNLDLDDEYSYEIIAQNNSNGLVRIEKPYFNQFVVFANPTEFKSSVKINGNIINSNLIGLSNQGNFNSNTIINTSNALTNRINFNSNVNNTKVNRTGDFLTGEYLYSNTHPFGLTSTLTFTSDRDQNTSAQFIGEAFIKSITSNVERNILSSVHNGIQNVRINNFGSIIASNISTCNINSLSNNFFNTSNNFNSRISFNSNTSVWSSNNINGINFGSNNSVFSSNTAVFSSNQIIANSNHINSNINNLNLRINFNSNLVVYSSNFGIVNSNVLHPQASFASNLAVTSSNVLHPQTTFGSNTSVYSSNFGIVNSNVLHPQASFSSNLAVYSSNNMLSRFNNFQTIFPNFSNTFSNTYLQIRHSGIFDGSPNLLQLGVEGSNFNGIGVINTLNQGVANVTPLIIKINNDDVMRFNTNKNIQVNSNLSCCNFTANEIFEGGVSLSNKYLSLSLSNNSNPSLGQLTPIQTIYITNNEDGGGGSGLGNLLLSGLVSAGVSAIVGFGMNGIKVAANGVERSLADWGAFGFEKIQNSLSRVVNDFNNRFLKGYTRMISDGGREWLRITGGDPIGIDLGLGGSAPEKIGLFSDTLKTGKFSISLDGDSNTITITNFDSNTSNITSNVVICDNNSFFMSNLAIGKSNPTSMLDVNGTITATGLNVPIITTLSNQAFSFSNISSNVFNTSNVAYNTSNLLQSYNWSSTNLINPNTQFSLLGSAITESNWIRLTDFQGGQTGTILYSNISLSNDFRLSFDMFGARPSNVSQGADGIYVNLFSSNIATQGTGYCVFFDNFNGFNNDALRILWNDSTIFESNLGLSNYFDSSNWVSVSLSLSNQSFNVNLNSNQRVFNFTDTIQRTKQDINNVYITGRTGGLCNIHRVKDIQFNTIKDWKWYDSNNFNILNTSIINNSNALNSRINFNSNLAISTSNILFPQVNFSSNLAVWSSNNLIKRSGDSNITGTYTITNTHPFGLTSSFIFTANNSQNTSAEFIREAFIKSETSNVDRVVLSVVQNNNQVVRIRNDGSILATTITSSNINTLSNNVFNTSNNYNLRINFNSNLSTTSSNQLYPQVSFASNLAVYSSNFVNSLNSNSPLFSSNLVVTSSNQLYPQTIFASNLAVYSSNFVNSLNSNSPLFSSNLAVTSSNQLYPQVSFSSNTSTWSSNNLLNRFTNNNINNTSTNTSRLEIQARGEGASNTAELLFGTSFNNSTNNGLKGGIIFQGKNGWSRGDLHFCMEDTQGSLANNNATLSNIRMTLTSAGNLGIGTSNPQSRLDVNGNTILRGLTGIGTSNPISVQGSILHLETSNNSANTLHLKNRGNGRCGLTFENQSGGTWLMNHDSIGNMVMYGGLGSIDLITNSNFRILDQGNGNVIRTSIQASTGNIGINVANPNGQLQFNNIINNRKIVLWEGANNDEQFYGFGIDSSTLRYNVDGTSGTHKFYAGINSLSNSELMRIQGNKRVGVNPGYDLLTTFDVNGTSHFMSNTAVGFLVGTGGYLLGVNGTAATNTNLFRVSGNNGDLNDNTLFTIQAEDFMGVAPSTQSCVKIGRNTGTGRSIIASGQITANFADLAEYFDKSTNFVLNKGDLCGINKQGKLTNIYSESIHFCVKSTDPGFCLNDTTDQNEMRDLVAIAGRVPLNFSGSFNTGDYVIPIKLSGDKIGIKIEKKKNVNMKDYLDSVGIITEVMTDGRPFLLVKTC